MVVCLASKGGLLVGKVAWDMLEAAESVANGREAWTLEVEVVS